MDKAQEIRQLEERIKSLTKTLSEADPDIVGDESGEYENKLTDEVLEKFVEGLLIVLGELEMEGMIPKIETPNQAKSALLGVIRRLYIKKAALAKQSRKFARFGAKQFLRRQRAALGKSLSQ